MLRSARLVAGKDLRIELRSRVALGQVVPFAVIVLILFAFALDPSRSTLGDATPGLFWLTVLFVLVLTVQRSFALEATDGARDALRGAGLDPGGTFLGKATAIAVQLLAIEVVLAFGIVVLYGARVHIAGAFLLAASLAATIGLASAGSLRCAGRRTARAGHVAPVLAPPGGRAGAHRGDSCVRVGSAVELPRERGSLERM